MIGIEAAALAELAETLPEGFAEAAALMLAARGRVILSGMGKSGHIARKIAATLASTGTPALYVHPAEASHGDLGMITGEDVVLLLSNSGETPELADLIAYTRRFAIPLIGVAGKADSTLLRAADIALVLPSAPEACSVGLAPTTSTTMTLALGDALAVALMEHRAFTPGGLRRAASGRPARGAAGEGGRSDARGRRDAAGREGAPMAEALIEMTAKGFGVVGVVDAGGALVGIVTDGDLRRHMAGLLERRVDEVMTRGPRTIATTALASEALGVMNARKITTLFAAAPEAPERPAGILHVHDCLRAGVV